MNPFRREPRRGIAEAFSNPLQHIREDFGTARFDQTFSDKDSFAAVYTIDDSAGHSPTSNPITLTDITLREQVASLSETHIFSPNLINRATFGFSRGAFYFNSGDDGELCPGWLDPNLPIGAVVVGGGTTLNGASQITNGGTNAGSNLTAVRNLFTYADQVTLTHGKHLLEAGVWFERIQANDTLIQDQYGQASFTSLAIVPARAHGQHLHLRSALTYAAGLAVARRCVLLQDTIKLRPSLELVLGFRGESTNGWNEAHGRASNYLFNSNGVIVTAACRRQLRSHREQREVPARAARWHRMVSIGLQENRDPRGLRHVLRADGQSQLSPGPESSVQHRVREKERRLCEASARRMPLAPGVFRHPQRRAAESPDADR